MLFRYKPNSSSLFASRNQVEIGKLAQMLRGGSVAQTQFFSNFSRTSLVGKGRVFIADADRIRQALTNYLTNALKFSPADQPIKIYLEVSNAQARVSVQDKGSGIPAFEQSRIWERFQQGQRQPGGSGGELGLGLYITRAIIQQHRGQVGIESHSGKGSTFWFTLPLAAET